MEDGVRQRRAAASDAGANGRSISPFGHPGEDKKKMDLLGYRHWLLVFIVFGAVYITVNHFHNKLPEVRPANGYEAFSEERARNLLREIVSFGPRVSGSAALEQQTFPLLRSRLSTTRREAERLGHNRLEFDTQHPTGCFDLEFTRTTFTHCYENITNVIARVGPAKRPADHALLLNCHIDTMPDAPGGTDDGASCVIMMEVLEILARSPEPLKYDVVFLFNGAEENYMQGSHGFIQTHPWRHSIRAFINLEGTGAGGRELLFQAGPGNSWLLESYLDAAPYPYCATFAQEIFDSGAVPSDTDFRIFRDYGRVSGLDIAYIRNGWVYHTEFDTEDRIALGSIQRAGENILAVVKKVLSRDDLSKPSKAAEQSKWIFYDVVGIFTVRYTIQLGVFLNVLAASLTFVFIYIRIQKDLYDGIDMIRVIGSQLAVLIGMYVVAMASAKLVTVLNLIMCWYSQPEIIFGLYVLPITTAGLYMHQLLRAQIRNAEMVYFDSILLMLAVILLVLTWSGVASAYFLLNYLLFAMLREPILYVLGKIGVLRQVTPRSTLFVQLVTLTPTIVYASYLICQLVYFFVAILGRAGNVKNPEDMVSMLSLAISVIFILFTNNLLCISRPLNFGFRTALVLFVTLLVVLSTTSLGVPYKYSEEAPRLRRVIAQHAHRTIYDFEGELQTSDNALFVQSFDYRSTRDLPDHSFLKGSPPADCGLLRDEYCRLPYYNPTLRIQPVNESVWIPVPTAPPIPFPISIKLLSRHKLQHGRLLNMTFELSGGYDKMAVRVTPVEGFELKRWSFTPLDVQQANKRDTQYVYLTYVGEKSPTRTFWLLLEHKGDSLPDFETTPSLELAVSSMHMHGKHQNSETIKQLRSLVASRRQTPHMGVGWWKWGMTLIAGVSELTVHQF